MNQKNFDRLIKDKLTEHDSQVPLHIWSGIDKRISKRRRLWYIPIALIILGLIAVPVLYGPLSSTHSIKQGSEKYEGQLDNENSRDVSIVERSPSGNAIKSHAGTLNSSINSESDKSEADRRSDAHRNDDSDISLLNSSSNVSRSDQIGRKLVDQPKHAFEQSRSKSNVSVESDVISAKKDDGLDVGTNQASNISAMNNQHEVGENSNVMPQSISEENIQTKRKQNSLSNENTDLSDDNAMSPVISSVSQSKSKKLIEERNRINPPVEKIFNLGNGQSLAHGHLVYDPCMVKGGKKKNRVHCFTFISQREQVFADFGVGPQYANQLLSSRNFESENLKINREDTESYLFAYNASARLGIKLANGLTGTSGLSFDRFHERFDYFDPNQVRTTITNVIVDTIYNNGNITYVWDTLSIQTRGERTVKHSNALTFISIPVTVGYTWQMEKFNLGVQGGLAFNLLFTKGGRIVQPDGQVGSLNGDGHKSVYKTQAGVSLLSSVVLEYKLQNDLSVFVEPRFAYQLSNLTNDDYLLDQNYWTG